MLSIEQQVSCPKGCNTEEIRRLVDVRRKEWKKECERDLRRFAFIRDCIAKSEDSHLVKEVNSSFKKWRDSAEFKAGIQRVKIWSKRGDWEHPEITKLDGEYHPDRDVNVHIVRYKNSEQPKETSGSKNTKEGPPTSQLSSEPDEISAEDNWKEIMDSETMKVHDILEQREDKKANRLSQLRCGQQGEATSYVHFPANNMQWVERAVACYYGQDVPNYEAVFRELQGADKTETYRILRPQYWRGQMHGSRSSLPHSRHMRSICESISSNPNSVSSNPRNLVLFMPYLHWEKDRCRDKFASIMDNIREIWGRKRLEEENEKKEQRQNYRSELHDPQTSQPPPQRNSKKPDTGNDGQTDKLLEILRRGVHKGHEAEGKFDRPGVLGKLLLDVAGLYEAMSNFWDQKLLEEYLYEDPPIHPRRTLDQAYYWTLESTIHRDRDQVIYRATTASPRDFRHLKVIKEADIRDQDNKGVSQPGGIVMFDHSKEKCDGPSQECIKATRMVSRVIMVDQLWMWILEEKTIITCFPRRYGRQKQDPSGVHNSIRTKLKRTRPKSVFDVALIILDECSDTFFDRTKTTDRQPRVIDTFYEAIGNIAMKETGSFEQLVDWTTRARACYRDSKQIDSSELLAPLLDINTEVEMHREIKDIMEELDIMISIVRSHLAVLSDFVTHVQHMLDPEELSRSRYAPGGLRNSRGVDAQSASSCQDAGSNPQDSKPDKHAYKFFMMNAEEVRTKMGSRITELEQLRKRAQSTCDDVKNLLDMKQQQAGVFQAWMALNQSRESVKQGRSIMLFTVVTIVFLPLSFAAGIFGMNSAEFGSDNNLHLAEQFVIMFPSSFCVIVITVSFAFSARLRKLFWLF